MDTQDAKIAVIHGQIIYSLEVNLLWRSYTLSIPSKTFQSLFNYSIHNPSLLFEIGRTQNHHSQKFLKKEPD